MEVLYEVLVMNFITRQQDTFISPQFVVRDEAGKPWSSPDFIALNFPNREVQIVEVSVSSSPKGLLGKVKDRNKQWLDHVKRQLTSLAEDFGNWRYVVRVFIRRTLGLRLMMLPERTRQSKLK